MLPSHPFPHLPQYPPTLLARYSSQFPYLTHRAHLTHYPTTKPNLPNLPPPSLRPTSSLSTPICAAPTNQHQPGQQPYQPVGERILCAYIADQYVASLAEKLQLGRRFWLPLVAKLDMPSTLTHHHSVPNVLNCAIPLLKPRAMTLYCRSQGANGFC